jgi:putative ABC transport system permease protein
MKATDILSYAFSAIKLRKLRAALTTLGVTIGIAAIVALLAFSGGLETAITSQLQKGLATDVLIVSTQSVRLGVFGQGGSEFDLFVNDTDVIEGIEGVKAAAAIVQTSCEIKIGDRTARLNIIGIDFSSYASVYSNTFVAETGEIPLSPDNDAVVIGSRIRDPWRNGTILCEVNGTIDFIYSVRSGNMFTNKTYTGTVVAVLAEIGGFGLGGGPSDLGIYIPVAKSQEFFGNDKANTIVVQLANSDETTIDSVTEAIENAYSSFGSVSVISSTAMLGLVSSTFSTVELFLAGIAGISLLVAGVGIMNIMIVSLMERTREIGILKALGMKNRVVLAIFLSESAIIGLLGAVIGVASGWGLANLVSVLIARGVGFGGFGLGGGISQTSGGVTITPVLTPTVLLGAFTFGLLISVVFALYPAWRASKLEPVEALRYE